MLAVEDVVDPAWRDRGDASWSRLVGATLARDTAMVGLGAHGILRVAARNDAARREVLAREQDLVASFNIVAARLGARRAKRVQCWVSDRFVTPAQARPPRRGRAPSGPIDPSQLAAAAAELRDAAGDADHPLREALVRARARALERAARSDET